MRSLKVILFLGVQSVNWGKNYTLKSKLPLPWNVNVSKELQFASIRCECQLQALIFHPLCSAIELFLRKLLLCLGNFVKVILINCDNKLLIKFTKQLQYVPLVRHSISHCLIPRATTEIPWHVLVMSFILHCIELRHVIQRSSPSSIQGFVSIHNCMCVQMLAMY